MGLPFRYNAHCNGKEGASVPRPRNERLARIHRWYAWLVGALALSGSVLYLPALRGVTAPVRVPLERLHIALGLASAALLFTYLPLMGAHLRSLGPWRGRRLHTGISVPLAALWTASGSVLWWERALLDWAPLALWVHDVTTWIGVPYLLGHALLRWRKVDLGLPWARRPGRKERDLDPLVEYHRVRDLRRRRALFAAATALGTAVAAGGWRWLLRPFSGAPGAGAEAAPLASPPPVPGPRSDPPVGGGARGNFRIYNVAFRFPTFDQASWRLVVDGLVRAPLSLPWEQVVALPRDVWVRDFHCVSGWSVYDVTWEGIPLGALLEQAGPLPEASHVVFHSYDGVYTDALTLQQATLSDVFLALLKDGKPLTLAEGGPVRLVVSRMFAYKSVKWLHRIEVTGAPHTGFWERHGYNPDAWLPGVPKEGDLPPIPRP